MSPQAAIEIGVYSLLVPAAIAFAIFLGFAWLLPEGIARRYGLGAALSLGVFVGFAVSPMTKALWPAQVWEWIPYVALLAAFAAGLSLADGVTRAERWLVVILVAATASWMIVPSWDRLADVRLTHVAALAAGLSALAILLVPLADRIADRGLAIWLMISAATTSLLIMSEWSEVLGRSAALPAGALAGCGAALLIAKPSRCACCLVLPYAVIVGCYAYLGAIYPQPPLTPLAVVPCAPLTLWLCTVGPLRRVYGVWAFIVQATCVIAPLVIAVAMIMSRSAGDEW